MNRLKPFIFLNCRDDGRDLRGGRPSVNWPRNLPRLDGFDVCSSHFVRVRWAAPPSGDAAADAGQRRSRWWTGPIPADSGPVLPGHEQSAGEHGSHGPGPRQRNLCPANHCLAGGSPLAFPRRRGMTAIRRRRSRGSSHIQPKTSVKAFRLSLVAASEFDPSRNGIVRTD